MYAATVKLSLALSLIPLTDSMEQFATSPARQQFVTQHFLTETEDGVSSYSGKHCLVPL